MLKGLLRYNLCLYWFRFVHRGNVILEQVWACSGESSREIVMLQHLRTFNTTVCFRRWVKRLGKCHMLVWWSGVRILLVILCTKLKRDLKIPIGSLNVEHNTVTVTRHQGHTFFAHDDNAYNAVTSQGEKDQDTSHSQSGDSVYIPHNCKRPNNKLLSIFSGLCTFTTLIKICIMYKRLQNSYIVSTLRFGCGRQHWMSYWQQDSQRTLHHFHLHISKIKPHC